MNPGCFGLLELGSNSLKFYRVEPDPVSEYKIRIQKIPWRIAHDFYRHGELREEAVENALSALRQVAVSARDLELAAVLSLATGVFREIPDIKVLARRVKAEVGVRLRVISGEDEAKLMARGFRAANSSPVLIADLGGSTTEWGWIEGRKAQAWGSLRLGAIRNLYLAGDLDENPAQFVEKSRRLCDDELKTLPVTGRAEVLVTGGTAKAVAKQKGQSLVRLEELREAIDDVARHGPPSILKPDRREVFLPGLVILERLLHRCEAPAFHYSRNSVREGMAARLVDLLDKRGSRDLHSTLLLHTSMGKRDRSERKM